MFHAANFALLVIDMQGDFLPGGPKECPNGEEIVPGIKKLISVCRIAGLPVIYTRQVHRKDGSDLGMKVFLGRDSPPHCIEGEQGAEIVKELAPTLEDYVVDKRRFSAFFGTDLEIILKGRDIDTLLLTGVATDVCVRATATDAMFLDYKVYVIEDCVAASSEYQQKASLAHMSQVIAKITTGEKVLRALKDGIDLLHVS